MGADYYARAVIGIALPEEDELPKATITTRKKAFKHDFVDDGENEFHPKTAKKLFLDEKIEIKTQYPLYIYDLDFDDPAEKDCNNQIIIKPPKGLGFTVGTDQSNICLGFVVKTGSSNGGDDYGFSKIPDVTEIKDKLKNLLEPYGLWDENKFGIHVILFCSY